MTSNIKFNSINSHIAELVIANPSRRNAMTEAMWAELPQHIHRVVESRYRVLILRGDGAHFCSGADISEFDRLYATRSSAEAISKTMGRAFAALAECPIPTIAAIYGDAFGGGCGLAVCCDIRISGAGARLAITPAKLGIIYPFLELKRLADVIGISAAKELLFTARTLTAEEAHRLGLVTHISENPRDYALHCADIVASRSRSSLKGMKSMFTMLAAGQSAESEETEEMFVSAFFSDDFRTGLSAFKSKEKPEF
jgi:enoyl-CoA hydratase/carnithine racemase